MGAPAASLALLLGLDALRLTDAVRRPRAGVWIGFALPAVLVAGAAWLAGPALRPDVESGDGRILLGLLASGPVAFQAYPVLFRPADDSLLRRVGFPARSLFIHRALRLLLVAAATVGVLILPHLRSGHRPGVALLLLASGALVGWAVALWTTARAADRTAHGARSVFRGLLGPDAGLIGAASLVYAPLLPIVAGAFAARLALGRGTPLRLAVLAALCALAVTFAARRFARALPRFAPLSGELAYAPPPTADGSELVIGRGLAGLLPRRAAAVRARDAVVTDRRFRWAGRLAGPVGVVAALALLRAGGDPDVRQWVTTACVAVLLMQGGAVIALGRGERGSARWLDRALGLRPADRFLGRWALAFGMALWLVVPLAFVWSFAVPSSPAWPWIAGAALGALGASAASLAAAGR